MTSSKLVSSRRVAVLVAAFFLLAAALPVSAQVIRLVSAPGNFYGDDKQGNGILNNYAAYAISNNTAVSLPSVYVAITNINSTNLIQLAASDPGVRFLGALAPGQTKIAAFYLRGPSLTGSSFSGLTNELHTIQVRNAPVGFGGSVLTSASFSYSNINYVIEASANKVTIITNLNPSAVLGSIVPLVIGGQTGTIGSPPALEFSPAVFDNWRADAYQLERILVVFDQNPSYSNLLYLDASTPGFTNFAANNYTNTYYFRASKVTGTNVAVSPFGFIASGTQIKHTALSSLTALGPTNSSIVSVTNGTIINHTVSPVTLSSAGGTVTYSITISNISSSDVQVDRIVDLLPGAPASVTFVNNSATYNAVALTNPVISGQTLTWNLPFAVTANSTSVLTFQAIVPATVGQYTNSVTGVIGLEQIDTTLNTFDNSPSLSVLSVGGADVAVGKSAPASVLAGASLTYAISVTNFGPTAASSVVVTDALPAGMTFVSATGGGVNNSGTVTWNLGSLANSQTSNLTVTVTAPVSGSLTNIASVGSSSTDSNLGNNTTPPVVTVVTPQADLAIAKSGSATVLAANNLTYTISVTNFGPSTASSVVVTDALPAGVTFVSASGGGVNNAGIVTWNLGNLANGAVSNVTVTVTAPASGSLTNSASVASPTSDPNSTNNVTPPVTTTVTPVADVGLGKTGPAGIVFGTNFNYMISVTNFGPSMAVNLSVTDSLPVGLVFVSAAPVAMTNAGNQVVWTNLGSLASGATTNLTLTVTSTLRGSVTNVASAGSPTLDPTLTNNTTPPVVTAVTNIPPLANPDSYAIAENTTNTFSPLVNDVVRTPGGSLTIIGVNPTNGAASISGTNIVFTPVLNFAGTATIGYTITDNVGGTNTGLITVTVTNIPPIANPDSYAVRENSTNTISPLINDTPGTPGGVLSIIGVSPTNGTAVISGTNITFTPTLNFVGTATIGYTITDGIGGTNHSLITITVTNLPPVANPDSYAVDQNSTNTFSPLVNDVVQTPGGILSLIGVSPTNGTASISGTNVIFIPTSNFTGTATIGYTITDGIGGTNSSLITVSVAALADVAVTKSGPANVFGATNFDYVITVTNAGPGLAASVTVTDSLPATVSFVSASGGGVNNAGLVTWSLGSLAAGTATNVTVTVTAPVNGGTLTNLASGGSPTGDPNPTNNTSLPVFTSVTPVADLAVSKTGPASVSAANNLTYTIAVTNFGPSTASSVVVTDTLPVGVAFVSASGSYATNNGVVNWNLGDLTSGQTSNLTLIVTAPAGGTLTNVASVSSPTVDSNLTNNLTPPVTTTVTPVADLAVSKTGPAGIGYGTNFNYTISVTNFGPSTATGISVTDSLPAGLSFVSSVPAATTVVGNQIIWSSLGDLAAGAGTNLTLTVVSTASGTVANLATGGSPTFDPNPTNNTGSPVVTVISKAAPVVTWPVPTNIVYGTLLSTNENDATASVPGTFVYNPTNGVVLPAGTNTLSVVFTPTDTNYIAASASVPLVVLPAPLTVAADNQVRGYNQANPPLTYTITGFVNSENSSVISGLPAVNTLATPGSPAGTYPITISQGTLVATNYSFSFTNGLLTVTNVGVTATWPVPTNVVYGTVLGTNQNDATASVSGSFDYNPTNGVILPVGTNTLTVVFTPTDTNYPAAYLTNALVVTPAPLVITALNTNKIYGQTVTFAGTEFTTGSLVAGDSVTSVNLASAGASSGAAVGSYAIVPSVAAGVGLSNYSIIYSNGVLTVGQGVYTTGWPALTNVVYGTVLGTSQNSATATVPGSFDYNPTNGVVLPVGTDTLTVVFTPTDTNYPAAYLTNALVVTPAPLTVAADNQVRGYNSANPLLTYTITGFVNNEDSSVISGLPALNTLATPTSPVGSYPITISQGTLVATNYTFSFTNGLLAVTNMAAVVTWPVPTNIVYGTLLDTNQNDATASVPGTFVYNPTNGVVLPAGTNTLSVVFTPTDTNYIAASASVPLVVLPAPLTVAADNQVRGYDQPNPLLTYTITGFVNSENSSVISGVPALSTTAVSNSLAGNYPITISQGTLAATNYSFSFTNGLLTVTNIPPVANAQTVATTQNTAKSITLTGTDPNLLPLTFVIVSSPANGTLSLLNTNTGAVTYTPAANYLGGDSFTFLVNNGQTSSLPATVSISVSSSTGADVQVALFGPDLVTVGDAFSFTNVVTNAGPATAVNTRATNTLPANLVFASATDSGVYSNGVVTWPVISSLANGQATNLIVTVKTTASGTTISPTANPFNFILTNNPPTVGSATNRASAYAATFDPNLTNNIASTFYTNAQAQTLIVPGVFSVFMETNAYPTNAVSTNTVIPIGSGLFIVGTSAFNPQTQLYEEFVAVTNIGQAAVHALRLSIGGLRSGVTLYNSTGTNNGVPYVEYDPPYNSPLLPGNAVTFTLEFFVADRHPFTNSLTATAIIAPVVAPLNSTNVTSIIRYGFNDVRNPANPRYLVQFTSIPGRTYTVEYSDDDMATWNLATPSIVASATSTFWYDDGPPVTLTPPAYPNSSRFYRVLLNP